ncbi:MAG: OmpA family protein, partial [Bdellovibrionales bacterium]|nr:OmpA family protein [Bdellovibrionales bacterium]
TDRGQTSLELLLGVKHDLTASLAMHAGAGTELLQGAGSPDWRVYAGVNYAFAPFVASSAEGQPELKKMAPQKTEERFIARNVNFEFGTANLDQDYSAVFAELVQYLNKPPIYKSLIIEGHTDSVGSEEYNTRLSQTRAQTIKDIMVSKFKLDASKIQAVGFGESIPIADNGNFQGRRENRRVEFKIGR